MVPSGGQLLDYQFMTLVHHRPIVNGFSGFATPLVSLLGGAGSPLLDFERFPAVVRMLRSLGVRYVLVHPNDYDGATAAAGVPGLTREALRASGQIANEAGLPNVTAFELAPWSAPENQRISTVDSRELTASASESQGRVPNMFDGDPDTRWIGGVGGQDGSSWVRVQLAHPADVARLDIQIADRSIGDYPRELRITGEDAAGTMRTLYDAPPYPELAAGIVRNGRYPNIAIPLPHNLDTAALWIRQTATSRAAWSIHELRSGGMMRPEVFDEASVEVAAAAVFALVACVSADRPGPEGLDGPRRPQHQRVRSRCRRRDQVRDDGHRVSTRPIRRPPCTGTRNTVKRHTTLSRARLR